jgi:hypothetical protein
MRPVGPREPFVTGVSCSPCAGRPDVRHEYPFGSAVLTTWQLLVAARGTYTGGQVLPLR